MSDGAPRILIIDDDPLWREMLIHYLKPAGYDVSVAASGTEGLRQVILDRPDLIICDIGMPHGNGYEVVDYIRLDEELRRIPVIACTGSGLLDTKEMSKELGFDGVLVKGNDEEPIREKVAQFLAAARR